ncbi:MAG: Lar family restriction alleviation protein [Azoarcus sp.]|nr:Lar family restriction alleviation protein [Azoarcus sp.]
MSNIDVKPCPFCGSDLYIFNWIDGPDGEPAIRWVECMKCGSSGPEKDTIPEIVAAWNAALRQPCEVPA